MIVILAGMQRSGSTFAFNVARDVLRKRGSLAQEYAVEIAPHLAAAGGAQHLLLKAHQMDALGLALARLGAVRVICTIRRPEDAVASWMQTFGFSEGDAIASVRAWLSLYARIKDIALTIDYATIDRHPATAARRIGRFLFPDVSWAESWQIARRHSKENVKEATDRLAQTDAGVQNLGFSYYDKGTLFHRRHVPALRSRAAEERLPADQLARIRDALGEPGAQHADGENRIAVRPPCAEGPIEAPFADGFRFRNADIWNLPLAKFDDRWSLFNHIIERHLAEVSPAYSGHKKCRFLELGVWTAGTVSRVFEHFGPIFDYTGVDPYGRLVDDPYKGMFWKTDDEAESVYSSAKTAFDKLGATLVRTSSQEFFASDNSQFDIVFVDGDHRYAGALYDCETGFGRLRPGGMLIVDDIGNSFHPEVEWAVREFTSRQRPQIRRMGAQPIFFQLPGMPVPVVLIFTYFQKA